MTKLRTVLAAALLFGASAALAIDPLPPADAKYEKRFQRLTAELRCLVCQNQNLADSDALLAKDLRNEVLEMMRAGRTDAEIKQFMVDRYGDFVLYNPPVKPITWALWFGPPLLLLVGAGAVVAIVRKRSSQVAPGARGEEDLP
ncbi:MAG TPA: cytochrome c-type biogenesis protein [Xanthomonadales bacterium]|nr:cytochrome c-type biogenesis protein [Xanthomonadales bacterium]